MFLLFFDHESIYSVPHITEKILGLSNIFGSLLVLGIPMGMYSLFLEQERDKSERLLHYIMPKAIADRLKKTKETISIDNPEISVLFADIVNFTVMSEKLTAEKIVGFLNDMFSKFDELAEKYKSEGMTAYSKIQQHEFARDKDGYTSVKHQREVGTSYFDAVSNTISSGKSSTTAMEGSTESEQF